MDLVIPPPSANETGAKKPPKKDKPDPGTDNNEAVPAQPAPRPSSPEDRSTTFQPVQVETPELVSGEKLLVEAYSAIWLVLFGLVFFWWRRQRSLDERVAQLSQELSRARQVSSTKKPLGDDEPKSSKADVSAVVAEKGGDA